MVDHNRSNASGRCRTLGAILCLLAIVAGCNSGSGGPETYPVTGKVTYKGEPIGGVTLTFYPQGDGVDAQAITDDNGEFDVSTYFDNGKQQKRGMVPGEYRVSAIKLDRESIKSTMQPPKNLLPQNYASPDTAGLTATVKAGEDNTLPFDL